MADMRLSDWITIFLTLGTLALCLFGVMILIVLWPHIVSIVSGIKQRMADEGAARRAYRQRVYTMSSSAQNRPVSAGIPVSVSVSDSNPRGVDVIALAVSLTEDQYIEIGARMRNAKGRPLYSGRKLYTLRGGNYNDFVAWMRRIRGEGDDDPMDEPVSYTPIVGRPTRAQFETDPDYPYQSPA